jgi:alpha-L-fucosidase
MVIRGVGFEAANVLDGDKKTYWATPDGKLDGSIELKLPEAREFSVIRLAEPIQIGQRICKFAVDVKLEGGWSEWISDGKTVGPHTLLRGKPVKSDGVRVRILESEAVPCLNEVSLWLEPDRRAG